MKPPRPPDEYNLLKASKEFRRMGVLLLVLGLAVLAVGAVAWQRASENANTSHYLFMAAFGIVLCAAGIFTCISGKPKK